jgi:hypothetical protein
MSMPLAPTFTPELDPVLRKVLEKLRGSTYAAYKQDWKFLCLQSYTAKYNQMCRFYLPQWTGHRWLSLILQIIRILVIRVMKQRSLCVLLLLLKHL